MTASVVFLEHRQWLAVVMFFIVTLFGVFLFWDWLGGHTTRPPEYIYFTLAPGTSQQVDLYRYDPNKKALTEFPLAGQQFTSAVSPDGKQIAYTQLVSGATQIVVAGINGENPKILFSTSTLLFARLPRWSPDGSQLIFNAQTSRKKDFATPDDWNVYSVNLMSGSVVKVSNGAYPVWGPTGYQILVLKNDGLYLIQPAAKDKKDRERRVWEAGNATLRMKLTVSADGTQLAWSNPDAGEIKLFSISSWAPFLMNEYRKIPSHSFWVIFSPQSTLLAAQEVDWQNIDTDPRPRLVFFDISTSTAERLYTFDLSAFNQQYMFMTDWR